MSLLTVLRGFFAPSRSQGLKECFRPSENLITDADYLHAKDFLLQGYAVPSELFLKEATTVEYSSNFVLPPKIMELYKDLISLWRRAIVLSLFTSKEKIVPVPFVIDTGAPYMFYLGIGARSALEQIDEITEVVGIHAEIGRLKGRINCGKKKTKHY